MGIHSVHAAWRHVSPSRAARWMRGLVHAVWEYVRMRMTHVVWNHMGMRMAHEVWKHIGMRTTHAVWGAGMRMNYMGMRMSGAAISVANGRRCCAACGMRGMRGACRRRWRRPYCRNGSLPKWRIGEMPYCSAVLLQRRAAASRRCCGVSQCIGALTRCRNGQCSIGTFSCCRIVALPRCRVAALRRCAALSRCRAAAMPRCRIEALLRR